MLHKIRSILFTPNSKLELWLRTQYHHLNQTQFFFRLQDWLSKRSYQRCQKYHKSLPLSDTNACDNQPKVSFLVSHNSETNRDLIRTIESIQNLEGANWEILVESEPEKDHRYLQEKYLEDKRIKTIQSDLLNSPDSIAGDFTIFCQAGDQFFKGLLVHFYKVLSSNNTGDWYYYDCEYFDEETNEITPLFKPHTLSPTLLLSINYLSRGIIRTSFIQDNWDSGKIDPNLLLEEYRLSLYLCEIDGIVTHIPEVLITQNNLVSPKTDKMQRILVNHLSQMGLEKVSSQSKSIGTRFTWRTNKPSVSIIIPTKNNKNLLSNCLESLFTKTDYPNYTIHLIDNNSDDPETLAYHQSLESESRVKIHPYPDEFNYSKAINLGVSQTNSDLVLFLNDDMEIFQPEWLTELVQWAIRPEIGVVGGKLIRANHTIQHAGIIIGLHSLAGHIYLNAPEHYQGLFGSVDWYRDYLALTGACQMVRREVFNEVGGYDEGYKIAFGDIDFCLRIHEAGYRNIYTPFAKLFHYEGRSRGYITPQGDILRAYSKMGSYLSEEDPFFSPKLTYTRIPKCVLNEKNTDIREKNIELRKRFYDKS